MLRAVFDTVIFVRALLNPKSRCGRLLFQYSDRYEIIVSQATARELLEVIGRPEITAKYKSVATLDRQRMINLLAQAETVELATIPAVVRDPKDDIFVATAIAGNADYLVSEDKDLLALGDRLGVRIVNAQAFIALFEPSGT
jgi:putative PIN family toxin of toxin-antitoxin system